MSNKHSNSLKGRNRKFDKTTLILAQPHTSIYLFPRQNQMEIIWKFCIPYRNFFKLAKHNSNPKIDTK